MYLAVDVGGTKTLVASFDDMGNIVKKLRFPTIKNYDDFLIELGSNILDLRKAPPSPDQFISAGSSLSSLDVAMATSPSDKPLPTRADLAWERAILRKSSISVLQTNSFLGAGVGIPCVLDREQGKLKSSGNLNWKNKFIQSDLEKIVKCPVAVENDAKLGALSEAILVKQDYDKVLYITIGTGIGAALVTSGVIDLSLGDSGGKGLLVEHDGAMELWENFASGKAIVRRFGKRASEIEDPKIWQIIARDLSVGLINFISLFEPEVVILGGGVASYYDRFADFLVNELKKYKMPLISMPPILQAQRPEEAVIYGCYELIRDSHAKST